MPPTMTSLVKRPSNMAARHPLLVFFLLSYVLGWLGFLPMVLGNAGLRWINFDGSLEFLELGACAPLLAALCTQRLAYGNFRICRLFSSWTTTLLAVLLGFGITLSSMVILPVLALLEGSPRELHWSVLVTPAAYGLSWVDIPWRSYQRRTRMEGLRLASFAGAIRSFTRHTLPGNALGMLASTSISRARMDKFSGLGVHSSAGLLFSIDDAGQQYLRLEHRCADGHARDL
jgi:hypothetical protein